MKFSKELIATLKIYATVNNGVVLNPGNKIMTRSTNGAIHAQSVITDTIEEQISILELTSFLNILNLSGENSEVTIDKNESILIKNGKSEINFPLADPSMIVVPKREINFPADAQVEFELTSEDFNQLMRVSRGMGCDKIAFIQKDGKIVVCAYNKAADNELKKPLYTFEICEYTGGDFKFVIDLENLKMAPEAFKIKLWSRDTMFASKWEGATTEYIIAVEIDSESNF